MDTMGAVAAVAVVAKATAATVVAKVAATVECRGHGHRGRSCGCSWLRP